MSLAGMNPSDTVYKEGFLTKQGGIVKNWKRRFFVLKGNILYYFKTEGDKRDGKAAGQIDLSKCRTIRSAEEKTQKEYSFEITVPDRTYYIFADNEKDKCEWMRAISRTIVCSTSSVQWDYEAERAKDDR
eukprot:GFYU01001065.1.p1 GENE.GFYU01001065.1~~GFYU01001065.1.p1  ORF type:complete len:130 (-),score=32.40 GFYU01001065.1:171-560(-)